MRLRATRFLMLIGLFISARSAAGHPALYHYLEINLNHPGEISVYLTVHAPELSDDVAPLEEDVFGAAWLSSLDDSTIATLVTNAERFSHEKFAFHVDDRDAGLKLKFPDAEVIRLPAGETEVPAGCFSGVGRIDYSAAENVLTVAFSDSAEKRLMLVINRPASFPEVFDIEPGSVHEIPLPPAPEVSVGILTRPRAFAIAAAIAGVWLMLGLANRCRQMR